jgi:drug/metabolite transporter (DMT)-like permease
MNDDSPNPIPHPPAWLVVVAFLAVYLSWGTTYFATKLGVQTMPPALFGGTRITLAGIVLLIALVLRGTRLRISRHDLMVTFFTSLVLFIGGNYFVTRAQKTVDSGVASVLVASTPLWMALLELLWPWGDRLTSRGWLGLIAGMGGVLLLLGPQLHDPADFVRNAAPLFVLVSAFSWALGSCLMRYYRPNAPHLLVAAYQMIMGGVCLGLFGLSMGEGARLTRADFTTTAILSFCYLLIVGSLIGFVAYTWLLGHVSVALAGTYAYINPLVAIVIGWLLGGEDVTAWTIVGMTVILLGVALVRSGRVLHHQQTPQEDGPIGQSS